MQIAELTLHETLMPTGRDRRLHGRFWRSETIPPNRAVLLLHGLGDHSEPFAELAQHLVANGSIVAAFDFPGHGRSPGKRGKVDSYDGLLSDIAHARVDLQRQFPDLPQVLVGHSMGANLALNHVLRANEFDHGKASIAGLVLVAPILLPKDPPPRPQILAAWLTGLVLRGICFTKPVATEQLTRDQQRATSIQSDPLRHNRVSLYLATQILSQGRWALDHASECDVRTLILYGDADRLIDTSACENLALRMGDNASAIRFPGMQHDLFQDWGCENVLQDFQHWLQESPIA